jgi:hypothetical protein
MAYIRDSWGWILHPTLPGLPAFAFQSVTASACTTEDHPRLKTDKRLQESTCTQILVFLR